MDVLVTFDDVAEAQRAQQALRRRFETVLRGGPTVIVEDAYQEPVEQALREWIHNRHKRTHYKITVE